MHHHWTAQISQQWTDTTLDLTYTFSEYLFPLDPQSWEPKKIHLRFHEDSAVCTLRALCGRLALRWRAWFDFVLATIRTSLLIGQLSLCYANNPS